MEKSLKISEIENIQICFRTVLLPVKETGLSYHINKNLIILDKIIKNHVELIQKIQKDFLIKNDKGEPIFYKMERVENKLTPCKDESGNYIEATKEDTLKDNFIDVKSEDYKKALNSWTNDLIKVDFFNFPKNIVEEAFSSKKLDGLDLTPILEIIITE